VERAKQVNTTPALDAAILDLSLTLLNGCFPCRLGAVEPKSFTDPFG